MTFLGITLISGFAVGADLTLPSSLQADIVDIDRLESGARRTGLYFALWGLATKLALGLSAGATFAVLGWVGFDAGAPVGGSGNGAFSLTVLVVLYALFPVVLKLVAVALIWNFSLGQKEQESIRNSLKLMESKG
jgi:Na+/melibiose symporter-like transporter